MGRALLRENLGRQDKNLCLVPSVRWSCLWIGVLGMNSCVPDIGEAVS